jgi:O-antigen/teichoic acid export membrane protein
MLLFSIPLFLASLVNFVSEWKDVYFLQYYWDIKEVGTYQAAYRLMNYFSNFLMLGMPVLYPLILSIRLNNRQDLIDRYLNRLVPQATLIWGFLISTIILFSDYLIALVFGHKYYSAVIPFKFLLVSVAFQAIGIFYNYFFLAYDRVRQLLILNSIVLFLNMIGSFIFIPLYSIWGAAVVTSVSRCLLASLYLIAINLFFSVKNFNTLIYPFLAIVSCAIALSVKAPLLKVIFYIGLILTIYIFCKKSNIFSKNDSLLMDEIDMPVPIKNGIKRIYVFLSARE